MPAIATSPSQRRQGGIMDESCCVGSKAQPPRASTQCRNARRCLTRWTCHPNHKQSTVTSTNSVRSEKRNQRRLGFSLSILHLRRVLALAATLTNPPTNSPTSAPRKAASLIVWWPVGGLKKSPSAVQHKVAAISVRSFIAANHYRAVEISCGLILRSFNRVWQV